VSILHSRGLHSLGAGHRSWHRQISIAAIAIAQWTEVRDDAPSVTGRNGGVIERHHPELAREPPHHAPGRNPVFFSPRARQSPVSALPSDRARTV
jgi:hypothetical protein